MRIVGIGVDVVEVERMRALLERQPRFRERVFTPEEVAYCEQVAVPAAAYAARWAAREAAAKALGGVPGMRYPDIRVQRESNGVPRLALDGAARTRAQQVGASEVFLSLSHERRIAAAFCVAVGG
ncbi:MAG TPA: holo-ACP synthase [Actinomycetota bacterium]|nr:holo-ACP synthase [Actinomycetota bacterium]